MRLGVAVSVLWLAMTIACGAVLPDEILSDAALETRARQISGQLRCLVCQNQSIDDSDADLARDLRLLVRERLVAGDSDPEVMQFIVDRYGEFVLLQPVVAAHTLILWLAAPVLLALGSVAVFFAARRHRPGRVDETLDPDEEAALASLGTSASPQKPRKRTR